MRPLTTATLALMLATGGVAALAPATSQAQYAVDLRVDFAPPLLPQYDQPPCPGYGYIWTPGYWAWGDYDQDYYWVPGTWVLPPQEGYLWTPAYWAFNDGGYIFTPGYWGLTVGFYGGINYGFGYGGYGYEGGYWRGRDFFYNRQVNNLGYGRFANVYDRALDERREHNRASFNGGPGGVQARPSPADRSGFRGQRLAPTADQQRHFQMARSEPSLRASFNHGAPPIAATPRPNDLRGPGAMPARGGGTYRQSAPAYTQQRGGPVGQTPYGSPYRSPYGADRSAPPTARPAFRGQPEGAGDFAAPPQRRAPPPFASRPQGQFQGQPQPQAQYRAPQGQRDFGGRPEQRAAPQPAAPQAQPRPTQGQNRDGAPARGDRDDRNDRNDRP